jgi:hypothetical protein
VLDQHPERTFAFDEFGPLAIRPIGGSAWARKGRPQRQPASYHRLHGVRQSTAAIRSATTSPDCSSGGRLRGLAPATSPPQPGVCDSLSTHTSQGEGPVKVYRSARSAGVQVTADGEGLCRTDGQTGLLAEMTDRSSVRPTRSPKQLRPTAGRTVEALGCEPVGL